jgi:hypothetical protein
LGGKTAIQFRDLAHASQSGTHVWDAQIAMAQLEEHALASAKRKHVRTNGMLDQSMCGFAQSLNRSSRRCVLGGCEHARARGEMGA